MNRLIKFPAFLVTLGALLMASIMSCSDNQVSRMLDRADNIMETDSYAAMDILDSIPRSTLSRSDSARFALLYTQAQIKNWIEVDSDTLIDHAYNYYKDRDQGTLTIRAYFYKAKVAYNRGDMRASMRDVLPAYEMAKEQNNHYWIAKTAELMADIFFDVYNYPQAEEYSKITIENYQLAGKVRKQRYAIADLGYILLNEGQEKTAVEMLDSLINICANENPVDSALLKYLQYPYIEGLLQLDSLNAIEPSTVQSMLNNTDTVFDLYSTLTKSWIQQQQNNFQEAEKTLNQALIVTEKETEYANLLYEKYLNAVKAENFKEASKLTDSLIFLQNNVVRDLLLNSVDEQKSRFYQDTSEISKLKKEVAQKNLYGIIIFSSCIILLLLIIYSLIIKNKSIKIENAISALMSEKERADRLKSQRNNMENKLKRETAKIHKLEEELDNKQLQAENSSVNIQSLFKNQWKTLNLLCDEYFEKAGNENTRHVLLNNLEKELLKLRSERNLQLMEEEVNLYLDNIMTKLRSQCPNLQSDDYTFLMLNFAGLSLRAICFFTGIKYKTFHNKKMRLIRRIEASDAQDKSIFLKQLGVNV